MTRDEAIKILVGRWAACQDAFGLVIALEELGVLKIEEPEDVRKLLTEAQKYIAPSSVVEISATNILLMTDLMARMCRVLKSNRVQLNTPRDNERGQA